jgi:hypothetical protein
LGLFKVRWQEEVDIAGFPPVTDVPH